MWKIEIFFFNENKKKKFTPCPCARARELNFHMEYVHMILFVCGVWTYTHKVVTKQKLINIVSIIIILREIIV